MPQRTLYAECLPNGVYNIHIQFTMMIRGCCENYEWLDGVRHIVWGIGLLLNKDRARVAMFITGFLIKQAVRKIFFISFYFYY